MSVLRERHPWMTVEEEQILLRQITARAARLFEEVGQLREAAECWLDLERHDKAAVLYAQAGDLRQAAESSLDGGHYAPALAHYRAWEAQLAADDMVGQMQALLGQAACHMLPEALDERLPDLPPAVGRSLYRQARAHLQEQSDPLTAARCWAGLGAYGHRAERYDLIHEGYEQALRAYETSPGGGVAAAIAERNETARTYLATVKQWEDRLLAQEIETRLAAWDDIPEGPTWQPERDIIESHAFQNGIRDALHFTNQEQWAAWERLAEMEDEPEIDAYLRTLAPPEMAYVPPGAFLMGSDADDPDARDNEKPQHDLRLRGYYIDRTPVTNCGGDLTHPC